MSYPITEIEGLDAATAALLKKSGVRSTGKLLDVAKDAKGRKALAAKTGIDEKHLLCLANAADRLRIKGLGKEYAELLQAAGVDTVKELIHRNPCKLAQAMHEANKARKLVRLLPSEKMVNRWIGHAKKLPIKISY